MLPWGHEHLNYPILANLSENEPRPKNVPSVSEAHTLVAAVQETVIRESGAHGETPFCTSVQAART